MTAYNWIGASSANWADPANWSPAGYPHVAGDTALIDAAGTYTISIANGETDTIDALTLNAAAATLSVNGTLAFGGANSATINAGTLVIGSTGVISGSPDLSIASGATLDITSHDQTVGSLSGSGAILLGSHVLTFGGDGASTTFSGTSTGGGIDSGALIKTGAGTLTLAGATTTNNELIISTGNLAVGTGTNQLFYLALGEGTGNSATATISGGVLNIGGVSPTLKSALQIGDFGGTGVLNQTAGAVNVTGSFNIGNQGGTGTYNLMGGSLALLNGSYDIGRNAGGNPAGSGTLNISGGLFDIQTGSVVLGNWYPNNGTKGQSTGLLHQTGGTVLVESGSQIFLSAQGNGEYDLDGGTLEVGGSGLRNSFSGSGTGALHMGGGTLTVTGSALTTDASIALDNLTSSSLSLGALNATFSGVISGAGTLEVTGTGTASFAALGGSGTVAIGANATVAVAGAVVAGETIAFDGAGGTLSLAAPQSFAGIISGFGSDDRLDLTGLSPSASDSADFNNTTGILTISDGSGATLAALHFSGDYTGDYFHLTDDHAGGSYLKEDGIACYLRGTRITTDHGPVAVEDLMIGDRLMTLDGLMPLKWVGRRAYNGWLAFGNPGLQPIRFNAGAIADNVPCRDLLVSPEHAMFLDGMLIPARLLVNGVTIAQADPMEQVQYFHLELERHSVIFAENAASESFVDDDSRSMFNNVYEFHALYPDAAKPAFADYCAPRVEDGFELEAIRRVLKARATACLDYGLPGDAMGAQFVRPDMTQSCVRAAPPSA